MCSGAIRLPAWLCLIGAAGCARSNPEGSGATSSSSSVVVAPEEVPGGVAWTLGQRNAFRLKLSSPLAFGDQANTLDFTVNGRLVVAPTAVHGKDASLFIILEKTNIESRVADPEAKLKALAGQLSNSGCFIEVAGGRVTELRFAPD